MNHHELLTMDVLPRSTASRCPVCGAHFSQLVVEVRNVPAFGSVLFDSRDAARNVARGDILLEHCERCGHLYNSAFDPARMAHSPVYENSLDFSPRFQSYASDLAAELIERYALHGKQIVDIGSGRGDFLKLLCDLGPNYGVGFDPSVSPHDEGAALDRVTFVADFFSEQYGGIPLDFVCSRHTLEHLVDPVGFVRMVKHAIGRRDDVPIYFEVPNALYTLRDQGIWDLIYEHHSYFCPSSLRHLCVAHGLTVHRLSERYAGQFLSVEAMPARLVSREADAQHPLGENDAAPYVDDFAATYRTKVSTMQAALERMQQRGQRCVLWGAGSKGVTFLNVLQVDDEVEHVVDVNPRKQGKYVSGTGQQIVAPEFLVDYPPDVVLVMNPIYLDEIATKLRQISLTAELMVV